MPRGVFASIDAAKSCAPLRNINVVATGQIGTLVVRTACFGRRPDHSGGKGDLKRVLRSVFGEKGRAEFPSFKTGIFSRGHVLHQSTTPRRGRNGLSRPLPSIASNQVASQ